MEVARRSSIECGSSQQWQVGADRDSLPPTFNHSHSCPTSSAYPPIYSPQDVPAESPGEGARGSLRQRPLFRFVRKRHWVSDRDPLSVDDQRLEISSTILLSGEGDLCDKGSLFHMRDRTRLHEASTETGGVWCLASVLITIAEFTLKYCDQLFYLLCDTVLDSWMSLP